MQFPAASITFSPSQLHFEPVSQVSHLPSTHCLPVPHDVSVQLQTGAWSLTSQDGVVPEHVVDVQTGTHLPLTHFCVDRHWSSVEQVLKSAALMPLFKEGADASPYPSFTLFAILNEADSSKSKGGGGRH